MLLDTSKYLIRAIVAFYKPDEAKRAREARLNANRIHTRNNPVRFPKCTYDISPRPARRAAARIGSTILTDTA